MEIGAWYVDAGLESGAWKVVIHFQPPSPKPASMHLAPTSNPTLEIYNLATSQNL